MTQHRTKDAESSRAGTEEVSSGPLPGSLEQQLKIMLAKAPPFLRLPRPKERCPYSGESRTGLYQLIAPCSRNNFKPPVKAVYKRSHKYAQRGQWLIPAENLFRYLLALGENSSEVYMHTAEQRAASRQDKATRRCT